MKKVLGILLIYIIVFAQSLTALAENSILQNSTVTIENNTMPDKSAVIVLRDNSKTDGKKSTDLKEFKNDFAEGYDDYYKPSKWEIAKNIAKYLVKAFVDDVKSYILFYPLFKR